MNVAMVVHVILVGVVQSPCVYIRCFVAKKKPDTGSGIVCRIDGLTDRPFLVRVYGELTY